MKKDKESKKPKEPKPREKTPKPTGTWCTEHHLPATDCAVYHR